MKYLKQFGIILFISFVGEILNHFIPLPIPAGIYGMILMFVGLTTGIIKLESIKETSSFLIEIMSIMFVPAAVGVLNSWGVLKANLPAYVVITVASTFVVMGVTGRVTQAVIRRDAAHKQKKQSNRGRENHGVL